MPHAGCIGVHQAADDTDSSQSVAKPGAAARI
jgi:hypothetical protein